MDRVGGPGEEASCVRGDQPREAEPGKLPPHPAGSCALAFMPCSTGAPTGLLATPSLPGGRCRGGGTLLGPSL